MNIHKPRHLFIALAAILLFMTACGSTIGTGSGNGNGASSETVLQVLQNSASTMKQLKSLHFVTTTTANVQSNASTSSTSATPTPGNITLNLQASGDEALPTSEISHVSLNSLINLIEIVQADKLYIQNTKGQWYVMDKSALNGLTGNPLASVQLPDLNTMLAIAETAQITDHGLQSLNGQNLRHISVSFDKTSFKQLLDTNQQLKNMLGQQNIDSIIDNTKKFAATLDLWINESTSYLHRTELKFNMDANVSSFENILTPITGGAQPSNVTTNVDSIVDLSNFNETVTITPPTNAIPTNDPLKIFGVE